MAYTPTNWVTGDTVTATKLNKLEQGVANAGGGGYDLVLYCNGINGQTTVLEGNILDCEQKVADGEPVNGILISHNAFSYTPSGANAPNIDEVYQLCRWHCPYCIIGFSSIKPAHAAIDGQTSFTCNYTAITYDPDDGTITGINNAYNFVNV